MLKLNTNSNSAMPFQQQTRNKTKLKEIKHSLRESMVKWMQIIAKSNQEAMEMHAKDPNFLKKNIWYQEDLIKACEAGKQYPLAEWVRINEYRFPPEYFKKNIEKTNDEYHIHFVVKADKLASDALNESVKGLTIIDCRVACLIARYGALLDKFGTEKFNRLFNGIMNLNYFGTDERQPIGKFIKLTKAARQFIKSSEVGNRPIKKGQTGVIDGVPSYVEKFPYGYEANFNIICSNDTPHEQKFIALGLNPDGETESEVGEKLLKGNNKIEDPYFCCPNELLSQLKAKSWKQMTKTELELSKKNLRDRFPEVKEVKGFNAKIITDFDANLVYDLMELPEEKISIDSVKKLLNISLKCDYLTSHSK